MKLKSSSERFDFIQRSESAVVDILTKPRLDVRGSFSRLFCLTEYLNVTEGFVTRQANISRTSLAGTVRGLHYQDVPMEEDKIVFCLEGSVWDVVVNVKPSDEKYLGLSAVILDSKLGNGVFIPKGHAHGFQSLEPNTCLVYFHSKDYSPEHQKGINPMDSLLSIDWPLSITEMSDSDRNLLALEQV